MYSTEKIKEQISILKDKVLTLDLDETAKRIVQDCIDFWKWVIVGLDNGTFKDLDDAKIQDIYIEYMKGEGKWRVE